MTSEIIKETGDGFAMMFSPETREYWIGEYSHFCTHQTNEPPYVWIDGNWTSIEEAYVGLALLEGVHRD